MNNYSAQILKHVTIVQKCFYDYANTVDKAISNYHLVEEELNNTLEKEIERLWQDKSVLMDKAIDDYMRIYDGCIFFANLVEKNAKIISNIDPDFNRVKQKVQSNRDDQLLINNSEDEVQTMKSIANRIGELGIEAIKGNSVFNFFNKHKFQKYAEIHYLVELANDICEKIMVQRKDEVKLQMIQIQREYEELIKNLKEKTEELLEETDIKTDRNIEKENSKLIKKLQGLAPPEILNNITKDIMSHEPNFSKYVPTNQEKPIIKFGFTKTEIEGEKSNCTKEITKTTYQKWVHEGNLLTLPFAFEAYDKCFFLIQTNSQTEENVYKGIQAVTARMLAQIPPTQLHCTFVDPRNAGRIFSPFMRLASNDKRVVGEQVYTKQDSINNVLNELYNYIDHIIQFKLSLGNGYENLYEYNKYAKENPESYKLLVVLNFPTNFTSDMIDKLSYIVENGTKCGVHIIITYDQDHISKNDSEEIIDTINKLSKTSLTFKSHENQIYMSSTPSKILFEFISPPSQLQLVSFISQLSKQIISANKKGTPFSVIVPELKTWFSKSSSDSLAIPIGKTGEGDHHLVFGFDTSQHAIVAGKTGSGKTSFLHTLITSACINYSPDELHLYLLDFKEGVEFIEYAKYQIPHVKLLGLESEQEFGESILKELQEELERRGEIFKRYFAQNLMTYREKSGQTLPRILLVIDEFQVLFDMQQNRQIANSCGSILDDLVRRGRSFGIHIILASQTVSDAMNSAFDPQTRSQMAVRIGLKADEKDAVALLGDDNDGIAKLGQEIGVAVYNSDSGKAPNTFFKIAYLSKTDQEETLQRIHEHGNSQGYTFNARVFSSQVEVSLEEKDIPVNVSPEEYAQHSPKTKLWLGKSSRVSPAYITANFNYYNEENMIILGQNTDLVRRTLYSSLCSALYHYHSSFQENSVGRIVYVDYPSRTRRKKDALDYLVGELGGYIHSISNDQLFQQEIMELLEEVRRRETGLSEEVSSCFLFINDIQRVRVIYNTESISTNSSTSFDDSEDPYLEDETEESSFFEEEIDNENPSMSEMFFTLLHRGPAVGIYTIVYCDTYNNLYNLLSLYEYDPFGYRVTCKLREDESNKFLGEDYAANLKKNYMICRDLEGEFQKFHPYQFPSQEWQDMYIQKITQVTEI
ncbi:FtsK/SpoIIIE domain-containing protein [Peribacillus frigoritolerans]|uniref:FtsK/SpoIIIE domain-containing protein n=1 Tax=Peribacillus frigoritolerans TaxID=450367 RepID=UPI003F83259B